MKHYLKNMGFALVTSLDVSVHITMETAINCEPLQFPIFSDLFNIEICLSFRKKYTIRWT